MANAPSLSGFSVFNMLTPKEGPKVIAYTADFTTSLSAQALDMVKEQDNEQISWVQALWFDNSGNIHPLQIDIIGGAPMRIKLPGGAMGMLPLAHTGHFRATLSNPAQVLLTVATQLLFFNVPQAYFVYTPGN